MQDPVEWVTIIDGNEITISITVPKLPGESQAAYEIRRDRIVADFKDVWPPVER